MSRVVVHLMGITVDHIIRVEKVPGSMRLKDLEKRNRAASIGL